MAKRLKTTEQQPILGERTKPQMMGVAGNYTTLVGFSAAPVRAYRTYRAMRNNPTIAIARMAATAPIRAASVSTEAPDAPDEMIDFIDECIVERFGDIVADALFSLDYGWKPFEKVWGARTWNGRQVIWLDKLKPLRVDDTIVLVDRLTGGFMGLQQGDVILPAPNAFVVTHDGEDGNFYGRSRHENIREHAYQPWLDTLDRMGKYINKASGVIPMVRYAPGMAQDAAGTEKDTFELAKAALDQLGKGTGIVYPIALMKGYETLARAGANIADLMAWKIEFLEVQSGHGAEFIEMLRHFERLMLRGWHVPERTVAEGTTGTRADSESAGDVATLASEEVLSNIVQHVNWHIIDPLLALNFGEDARGMVQIKAAPLVDTRAAFLSRLAEAVFTNPGNIDLLLSMVDMDALLDQAGLPKSEGTIDPLDQTMPTEDEEKEAVIEASVRATTGKIARTRKGAA